jgi:hypothetical protein
MTAAKELVYVGEDLSKELGPPATCGRVVHFWSNQCKPQKQARDPESDPKSKDGKPGELTTSVPKMVHMPRPALIVRPNEDGTAALAVSFLIGDNAMTSGQLEKVRQIPTPDPELVEKGEFVPPFDKAWSWMQFQAGKTEDTGKVVAAQLAELRTSIEELEKRLEQTTGITKELHEAHEKAKAELAGSKSAKK